MIGFLEPLELGEDPSAALVPHCRHREDGSLDWLCRHFGTLPAFRRTGLRNSGV